MRRVVRDYVAAALCRQQMNLECFIAECLEYPDAFPLELADRAAAIREASRIRIRPRFQADYPPVDLTAGMRVAITATATR